jgi:predicted GIY-YIG superfamily endonuclease
MPTFHYVYVLVSQSRPDRIYIGYTAHLKRRLAEHNEGSSKFTSKYRPWRIRAAIALQSRERAFALELYLKTHSGRALISMQF